MARYRLKHPVEIAVRFVPEQEVRRKAVKPAHWRAVIVNGGPRKSSGTLAGEWSEEGSTREAAVDGLITQLRAAGYAGRYRVVEG